ncbi:MAG: proline dehydrogenase family protein [Egibacteraceae bacterium]
MLLRASENALARRAVTSWPVPRRIALRFVAGDTLADGIRAARALAGAGKSATLDYLGERVTSSTQARTAAEVYLKALGCIGDEGQEMGGKPPGPLDCGVSVKPTQMGLHVDAGLARDLIAEIVAAAEQIGAHVTLDMEGSDVTEATVGLVERLRAAGHTGIGCALQAYLRRTRDDLERLCRIGASVRLCKGAYAEPPRLAFQARAEVDESYAACAELLLRDGTYPRIATHDYAQIAHVQDLAARLGLPRDAFEFQMLYGVRPALQDELVREGYRVRIYVPFGEQWYPYFMRRLAERPANLAFFLRALRGD